MLVAVFDAGDDGSRSIATVWMSTPGMGVTGGGVGVGEKVGYGVCDGVGVADVVGDGVPVAPLPQSTVASISWPMV